MKLQFRIALLCFFSLILLQKSYGQAVGSIDKDGNAKLIFSESKLLESWNTMIKHGNVKAEMKSVSIVKIENDNYALVAKGGGYTSTCMLAKKGSVLSIRTVNGFKTTCTTKACDDKKGCMPNAGGACTPCSANPKDCMKSTSNAKYLF